MNQLLQLVARLTWPQRIGLIAAAATVVGGLLALQSWNRNRGFSPLFSGLSPEDAGPVAEQLRTAQIDYRVADGGSTILVKDQHVAEVRLQLAAAGVPRRGRIGFELFDQTNFGASEFAEQINYHRAIEGELERSVISIREVEGARVHITLPKESLYKESRQPAKASVLVKLRAGGQLTAQNVTAIAQLAASAVPGLHASQVSVLDTSGNLLSRPSPAPWDEDAQASEAALAYRNSVERAVQSKLAGTLEPLLGPGRFRIGVSADIDLTSGDLSEEIFDPEKSVMVASQTAEDGPSASRSEGGVPGTSSNLPRPTGSQPETAAGVTGYARRTENISYQTSRIVRHTRIGQGGVKRLSLSILVDHDLRYEQGQPVVEAPTPEKLQVIRDLAAAAVGLDPARGDQLVVEAFPFESTLTAQPLDIEPESGPSAPTLQMPAWITNLLDGGQGLIILAGAAAGIAGVSGSILFFVRRRGKKAAQGGATTPQQLSAAEEAQKQLEARLAEQTAEQQRKEAEAILSLKLPAAATKKSEVLTKHIAAEIKKDPQAMAHVVRSWLNGEYHR